jgi:hypothetical protein
MTPSRLRLLFGSVSLLALVAAAAASGCSSDPASSANPSTGGASASGGAAPGGSGGSGADGNVDPPQEPVSAHIVVDQFGYLPDSEKIAVVRLPVTGFDAGATYTPAANYVLMDAATKTEVLSAPATAWNGGAEDPSSGDRASWFDFSSVTTPGTYYVLDPDNGVRSDLFRIADDVYREVLKQAVRTFFYQRAGFAKEAAYAGAAWADGASHVGPLQDTEARRFDMPDNAATARDVSGGWYDAGDYNKYTNWTARYVIELLRAYAEAPTVFGDDYDLPESGNGVPDIVDEARFGMDHLVRLQQDDGSVLSIVGLAHASPPSAATGPSRYGLPSTSATLSAAAAYAYGAVVLRAFDEAYADTLVERAEDAWTWATNNPAVTFQNNESGTPTAGLGAGQQEVDDVGRDMKRLEAAVQLYRATGKATYKTYFDTNYEHPNYAVFQWGWVSGYHVDYHEFYLDYRDLPDATTSVVETFLDAYRGGMASADNFGMLTGNPDPYLAHIQDYTWGSNAHKARTGLVFQSFVTREIDAARAADARRAAERYVHYLHGVNPLGMVYLSNMGEFGAHLSANEFYHTWFADGSPWDRVGESQYGPAPGFLTGGPNESYYDYGCCPNDCGSAANNALCDELDPPRDQPKQKSYRDFNTSWPMNSWEVTENSNGYQVAYIRLLSKFVR